MNSQNVVISAALSSVALVLLTIHASRTNAFDEPSTFVGIVVGIALACAAWFVGKRVRSRRAER